MKICHQNTDIFAILSKKSSIHDIFINIPETLLYSSHGKNPIFLYNSQLGFIQSDSSDNSIDNFFEHISINVNKAFNHLPLLIHKSKGGGNRLYFDIISARKAFEECPYRYHILQKFVQVSNRSAWKVSVDWLEGSLKYFTLVNNLGFNGGLFNKGSRISQDINNFVINYKDLKSYHIVAALQPIYDLSKIVKKTVPVINKMISKHRAISEVVVDFIKDIKGRWVLISVQGCIYKGDSSSSGNLAKKLAPLNPRLNIYPTISFTREKSDSSPEDLQESTLAKVENRRITKISRKIFRTATKAGKQFKNPPKVNLPTPQDEYHLYLSQKSSDQQGRIPFHMIGIVPHKLGSHLTYFVEDKREMVPQPSTVSESYVRSSLLNDVSVKHSIDYLERISKELDSMTNLANTHKKQQSVASASSYESNYDDINL